MLLNVATPCPSLLCTFGGKSIYKVIEMRNNGGKKWVSMYVGQESQGGILQQFLYLKWAFGRIICEQTQREKFSIQIPQWTSFKGILGHLLWTFQAILQLYPCIALECSLNIQCADH